jgi:hypothetical protein
MKFNNTSKIIRVKHSSNFTQLSNDMLRDKDLSWKAKGLLACIISLPDEWVILKTALQQFSRDGRDGTIAAFNELIKNGYVTQLKIRDEKGKFARVDYVLSDIKITEKPITDNPLTDKPKTDKPNSENTHVINTIEPNTLEANNVVVNNELLNTNSIAATSATVIADYEFISGNTIDFDKFKECIKGY